MTVRALLYAHVALAGFSLRTITDGQKYLDEKSKETGVVTLPSGLEYKVLEKGSGKYHPTADSPCSVDYEGKLIDGTKFDSSYDRGEPTTFAPNQVIPGWTEAMQKMVEGDKWELYIPSNLAYGPGGTPDGTIPPDSTLVSTMQIHKIEGDKVDENGSLVQQSAQSLGDD